jgi:MFS family permease
MTTSTPPARPARAQWGGLALTILFLVGAALLFIILYVAFPASQHFWGLIWIGISALILALASYFAESASRDPTYQRSLGWGFFGMGFAVLFLTIGLAPSYGISLGIWQYIGLLLVVLALAVAVGGMIWRTRAVGRTADRQVVREQWRERPAPSAFSYAAANSPSVPATSPPPGAPPSPPSSPPRSP